VDTLSREDLARLAAATLGAALGHEPGVSSSGFAPGAARPVIRGQGGERVRVLENGTGSLDVSGISDDHAVPVDPSLAEHVEVLRGPATLRYGANAIGGVVSVRDGRVPEASPGRRLGGRAGGALGTADEERSGFAVLEGGSRGWAWRAGGFARESDDLDIPGFAKSRRLLEEEGNPSGAGEAHGRLPNSHARAHGGTVGASRVGSWGFAGVALGSFSTDYGVPNEPEVHIELERTRVDARGSWGTSCGSPRVSWDLAWSDYEHTEFEGDEAGTVFRQDAFEGRAEWVHARFGAWEGALGVHASHADLRVVGEEALLPKARTTAVALFAVERRPLGHRLTLELGARWEHTFVDSVGDEEFDAASLSGSLVWSASRSVSATLAAAYTSRAPTAFELYADGPHVATGAFEVGDPDLGLERSLGLDLTVRAETGRLSASATGFVQHYLEYVALIPTGDVDLDSGLDVFRYVGHEARLLGAEARGSLHLACLGSAALALEATADAVRADDLDLDAPLPRIPPVRVGAGLVLSSPSLTARVDALHAWSQHRTAPFERATDAYTTLGASIARTWGLGGGRRLTASLVGTNLLDEEVRLHTSFTKDVAPERGRSVRLSLEVDF
jgi:iron complex outermembrane receptor protein